MSRHVIFKIVLTSAAAVALFVIFNYLDDNYMATDRHYSLLDVIAYLVLIKVAFFDVPKLDIKISNLEKRLSERQD